MSAMSLLAADPAVLAANWETTPFVSTGLGDFGTVFSVETVERLICSGTLPIPDIRLFRDGTQLPVSRCARAGARFGGQRERLVDGAVVEREIAAGATLTVEEVQTFSPEVGSFAAELTAETGCRVYCTAFVTPAGGRGAARTTTRPACSSGRSTAPSGGGSASQYSAGHRRCGRTARMSAPNWC